MCPAESSRTRKLQESRLAEFEQMLSQEIRRVHVRWGEVAIMAMSRFKKKEEERVGERRRQGRGEADRSDGGPRSQSHVGGLSSGQCALEASVTCFSSGDCVNCFNGA